MHFALNRAHNTCNYESTCHFQPVDFDACGNTTCYRLFTSECNLTVDDGPCVCKEGFDVGECLKKIK